MSAGALDVAGRRSSPGPSFLRTHDASGPRMHLERDVLDVEDDVR